MVLKNNLLDIIIKFILNLNGTESYLHRYQGYRSKSCIQWKNQCNFNWRIFFKVMKKLKIIHGVEIRSIIRDLIKQNSNVFSNNYFVTSFGGYYKSGDVIMYEFNHSVKISENKKIKIADIPKLPPHSKVIFVEDIIGTGKQSLNFINKKLNPFLNSSHIPYLLTLCATPEGIEKVEQNSNFTVLNGMELNKKDFQFYSQECKYFSTDEKQVLYDLNNSLKNPSGIDYDKGLLLSFSYTIPNNSMPILWKEGFTYKNKLDQQDRWFALLPREY